MNIYYILLAILLIPLGAGADFVFGFRRRGKGMAFISVTAAFAVMALSLYFLWNWDGQIFHRKQEWFRLGNFTVSMGFLVNNLTATMLLVISFVGFWIHVFSLGYMKHDKSKARFFACLSIFMFSMLGIVLADNLIMLFVFWELVGFSSYALIAHYSDTEEATQASKKAFIVNRVGDFGFLIGIIWAYWHFSTVDLAALALKVQAEPELISAGIAYLLMCGFLGKSAQFPLQVWLPDAMAGPTPVSALIHAATMVAAGIYFIARVIFLFPPEVLHWILWLGTIMTVYAGFCALAQNDIKKILAYSTLSQIGYMAVALGLRKPGLAMFHLTTHACFKALLFLGVGSIIHALHHEQNIFRMGGLIKKMPITALTFVIGLLALCGATYTSGFFSKDAIIEASLLQDRTVFCIIIFSAFLTALYMGRLFWVVFFGKPKSISAAKAHESSFVMLLPLIVLAALAAIAGYIPLWPEHWSSCFATEFHQVHQAIAASGQSKIITLAGTLAWVLGIALSCLFYRPGAKEDALSKKAPLLFNLFKSKLWFDELYNFYVSKVQQRIASLLNFLDIVFISGILVRGTSGLFGLASLAVKASNVGSIHGYVYWFLAGVLIFGAYVLD